MTHLFNEEMSEIFLHWNSDITVECFNTNKLQKYIKICFELKDKTIIKIKYKIKNKIEIVMKIKIRLKTRIKIKGQRQWQWQWDSVGKGKKAIKCPQKILLSHTISFYPFSTKQLS